MKRVLLFLSFVACTLQGFAQLKGDGYYRVRSYDQQRYVTLVDNRGSIDVHTTSADMGALCNVYGFERVVSSPASIIYIKKMSTGYDLQSQGTGSFEIVSCEVTISSTGDGTYFAYVSKAGFTKYLADAVISWMLDDDDPDRIWGTMAGIDKPSPTSTEADWEILPVSSSSDNYFGITPTVSAGNAYYQSFYAIFPFTFSSTGMAAYYVSQVDPSKSAVVIKEMTGGVPKTTPVIIKCSSDKPANNKLNVGAAATGSAPGNLLKGVIFCNNVAEGTGHKNVVEYNPETMRVLDTASDGSLAFVKSSTLQYIPANTAYITVSSDAPAVLKVYTQDEYDQLPAGTQGDLNDDAIVDIQDLGIVVKMILGSLSKTTQADLNGDGDVDIQDLGIIVKKILNNE